MLWGVLLHLTFSGYFVSVVSQIMYEKGREKKHEQLLCGELNLSSSLRTEFVNRAAKSDEVLLKDVQTPSDKTG